MKIGDMVFWVDAYQCPRRGRVEKIDQERAMAHLSTDTFNWSVDHLVVMTIDRLMSLSDVKTLAEYATQAER